MLGVIPATTTTSTTTTSPRRGDVGQIWESPRLPLESIDVPLVLDAPAFTLDESLAPFVEVVDELRHLRGGQELPVAGWAGSCGNVEGAEDEGARGAERDVR